MISAKQLVILKTLKKYNAEATVTIIYNICIWEDSGPPNSKVYRSFEHDSYQGTTTSPSWQKKQNLQQPTHPRPNPPWGRGKSLIVIFMECTQ